MYSRSFTVPHFFTMAYFVNAPLGHEGLQHEDVQHFKRKCWWSESALCVPAVQI